jgi:hypothetical protein
MMRVRNEPFINVLIAMAVAAVILAASCYSFYYYYGSGFLYDLNMYLHIIPFALGYGVGYGDEEAPVIYFYIYYGVLFILFTIFVYQFLRLVRKKGKS